MHFPDLTPHALVTLTRRGVSVIGEREARASRPFAFGSFSFLLSRRVSRVAGTRRSDLESVIGHSPAGCDP